MLLSIGWTFRSRTYQLNGEGIMLDRMFGSFWTVFIFGMSIGGLLLGVGLYQLSTTTHQFLSGITIAQGSIMVIVMFALWRLERK